MNNETNQVRPLSLYYVDPAVFTGLDDLTDRQLKSEIAGVSEEIITAPRGSKQYEGALSYRAALARESRRRRAV